MISLFSKPAPDPAEALKTRAQQFYSLIKSSQLEEASKMIAKEQRKAFFTTQQGKFESFRVGDVRLDPNGLGAFVQMIFQIQMPMIARAVDVERWVHWKKEGKDWYFDPAGSQNPAPDRMEEARARMFDRMRKKSTAPPLQLDLEKKEWNFGIQLAGTILKASFPLVNRYPQEIRIEKIYAPPEFIKDVTTARILKPGEKGEILLEVDTSKMIMLFESTVLVELQPINELLPLRISGDVRKPNPPKKSPTEKPAEKK
jgi:hypothetical protein